MSQTRYENPVTPSAMDNDHYGLLRANIIQFYDRVAEDHCRGGSARVLDVAPERHAGIRPHLPAHAEVETLDIDAASGATYILDLCDAKADVPEERFDVIVCTEVLEHTLDPFLAVQTLRRMLKEGGCLCVSTPFNFRIHGPLPDCWRFTEHGLRRLLWNFKIDELRPLDTPGRPLMPIQYTVIARKLRMDSLPA